MGGTEYLVFPNIDPVIVSLGPLSVRWYGMMYLVGFIAAYLLAKKRLPQSPWNQEQLSDLLFWGFVGVIIGGRLGYVFFYQWDMFISDPAYLFKIWTGGMSFHGGLLGVIGAMVWQAKRLNSSLLKVGDFIAPLVPIGLGAGRIGNFLNAELWGRQTDVPWAFVFPGAGPEPRHPSQLYEFALEGVLLFIILWLYSARPRPTGAVAGLFLVGYGAFRFIVEYFREPDAHIGLYQIGLSQGQLLCLPMILAGLWLMVMAYRKGSVATAQAKQN
ncbi:MAG: prolipoprotein diacylglyceryl transferase [Pseudomonadota bacterium]|jgi:phosphatidylglycerol:prolipoprotein diacylglycerol transferase|uniref:prolipoprotein diacylglyceryl transferase n=1 Tax=Marisediminitalea TaxID=2662254 RepID=UPI000C3B7AFA|nr:prolipoprotein diacylglyceryl transferase [Marisediminitalea aggregata]MBL53586.1 prolipoprotein diacylglyceryl transferase [Alteromonadaceae bacterium]MCP3864478.1 prolipoprotein diacylglyceryl transferase [Aestuariibacter sp.]MEC8227195.1 prolipoprotein diacylglyceryl transferase [Pseudomonadota bacterium]MCP4236135.1 prolipoprotein diacylglyceryl transferase [Aestuariibacter sp.]MCP4526591.1 prolipoprotein diacylglyceryl transferase [Aestuariibacter sp.]|tara:strand:- start:3702 stop:4517 length:816 start_codon:yes stop_codon:yes gene_type:complete